MCLFAQQQRRGGAGAPQNNKAPAPQELRHAVTMPRVNLHKSHETYLILYKTRILWQQATTPHMRLGRDLPCKRAQGYNVWCCITYMTLNIAEFKF